MPLYEILGVWGIEKGAGPSNYGVSILGGVYVVSGGDGVILTSAVKDFLRRSRDDYQQKP